MFFVPETESVSSLCKEMNLCRHSRVIKSAGVENTVADGIDRVIPSLHQKCWWRLLRHVKARIECAARAAQVARIQRDSKVRTTTYFINSIDWLVRRRENVTRLRNQISPCRKADYSNFCRIKV